MFTRFIFWPWFSGLLFLIFGLISIRNTLAEAPWLEKLLALGPVLYAVPLAVFSAEHLVGAQFLKEMVPRWIPGHLFWAYFVGLALLSAAVSILLKRYVGLAGTLLGIMLCLFVLLVHAPRIVANPGDRISWTVALRDLAFAGAAWVLAGSRSPGWRASGTLIAAGCLCVAVPTVFFGAEYLLHPISAPGVPLEMMTPSWIPLAALWGYLTGAILLVAGFAVLLNRKGRIAAALAGLAITLPVFFIYLPLLFLAAQPSGMNEATNYIADTLLFAGTLLLVASRVRVSNRRVDPNRNAVAPLVSTLVMIFLAAFSALAQTQADTLAKLTIDTTQIVSPVSPMLYGLMTEEINHSYDGGLYAEMVQNRAFHSTWEGEPPWGLVRRGDAVASRSLDKSTGPSQALPYSMKLTVASASATDVAGLTNPGYWGFGLRPKTSYTGSLFARIEDPSIGPTSIQLISDLTGEVQAQAQLEFKVGPWARYEYKLTTGAISPSSAVHLELTVEHPGTLWLQLVSLMQPTFNGRPNGNRVDLMNRMTAMHPRFLRLPGGNYLEGMQLADWYDWKKTIGPVVDRPGHQGPWFYWSTDGLGLLEFLEWCEDLKVEPVLAIYAGYSLGGSHVSAGKDLAPYVQSALDEVEYVTGDVNTRWGAERARDGHPAPFPLHYIEVGNEDYLDKSGSYPVRYAQFAKALHKAYPQYKLVSTDGNSEYATKVHPDISDEHYYKSPADMMDLVHHYDTAPRTGPKIFVGEWATRSGTPTPNFGDALGDAAWMTSMERNSDLIIMASYAPLLVNVSPGAMQWPTDLIGFDTQTTYASPSYWAQCLFAGSLGDGTPRSSISDANKRFFYSATVSSGDRVLHLKLVNGSTMSQALAIELTNATGAKSATMTSLHAATYEATNSIGNPDTIHPVTSSLPLPSGLWTHTVPALTIEVLEIPLH